MPTSPARRCSAAAAAVNSWWELRSAARSSDAPSRRGRDARRCRALVAPRGRQVPAAGVPFLPGHPEPGEELRRSAARSRLPAGIVLPTVLLSPDSEHAEAGPGGGARAAAAELPQP